MDQDDPMHPKPGGGRAKRVRADDVDVKDLPAAKKLIAQLQARLQENADGMGLPGPGVGDDYGYEEDASFVSLARTLPCTEWLALTAIRERASAAQAILLCGRSGGCA